MPNCTPNSLIRTRTTVAGEPSPELHGHEALLDPGASQKAIFNSANFSSIATDARGVIQIFNVGAERMLGYAAADVVNKLTPADISDPQELIARAEALSVELESPIAPGFEALVFKASRGIEDIYELTYIRADGSRFPAVVSVTALRDARDAIIGYLLIGTDNTARKEAELAIRENDALLRTIHMHSIVSVTDRTGCIVDVNDSFCRISGYDREELVGKTHRIVNSGVQGPEFWIDLWRGIGAGQPWRGEICNRAKDGSLYWMDSIIAPFPGEDGRTNKYISNRTDITERKQHEASLREATHKAEEANRVDTCGSVAAAPAVRRTDIRGRTQGGGQFRVTASLRAERNGRRRARRPAAPTMPVRGRSVPHELAWAAIPFGTGFVRTPPRSRR
jgi:PAS domain S-box-containing protein